MKRILFLALAFVPVLMFGQRTAISLDRTSGGVTAETDPIYAADSLGVTNMKTGIFNILDYGAIEGDTLSDSDALQDAINAAFAYGTSLAGGTTGDAGTVYIPPGKWFITVADTLKSQVNIIAANGAMFNFTTGYTGAMWVNPSGAILRYTRVTGGNYRGIYLADQKWDFVRFTSTSTDVNWVSVVKFDDIVIWECNTVFKINASGTGWINGGIYTDIRADRFSKYLEVTKDATGDFSGNIITNSLLNCHDTTTAVFTLSGNTNTITGIKVYDLPSDAESLILDANAASNILNGSFVPTYFTDTTYISDLGTGNSIINNGIPVGQFQVRGKKSATGVISATNYSNTDYSSAVLGTASSTGVGTLIAGVRGLATTTRATGTNIGVYGKASGTVSNFGGYFEGRLYTTDNIDIGKDGGLLKFNFDVSLTHSTDKLTLSGGALAITQVSSGEIVDATGITSAHLATSVLYYSEAAITDITADPQIANGTSGQILTIIGSSDTNTLTLDDAAGLNLSAQCVLGAGDVITLMYVTTLNDWVEVSRTNN